MTNLPFKPIATRRKVKYPDISWTYLDGFDDDEMLRVPEENLQACLVAYIAEKYPNAIFLGNVASNVKLGWKKAVRQKAQGNAKNWPDIFIARPAGHFCGCFLELKKFGTRIKKDDFTATSAHIQEQLCTLQKLRDIGYYTFMPVGWREAKAAVDFYLSIVFTCNPNEVYFQIPHGGRLYVQK